MAEKNKGFSANAPVERRRFPRLIASVDVEYSILRKGTLQEQAVTKNISAGGICLIVYEKIEPGTFLALKILLSSINYIIEAKAKVIWSSYFTVGPDGRDRYDLGIEFVEINESDRQKISQYVFKLIQ